MKFPMISCLCLTLASIAVGQHRTNRKPKVIFIIADDLGYGDLSSYGQQKFTTPNIDKLAGSGMKFTQHYAGAPVCAPSRSALMTGLHCGHTPIRGNKEMPVEGQYPLPDSVFTIADMFQRAGYATGAFGKWGLGYPKSEGEPGRAGFPEFYGYNCQRLAHNYYPDHLWNNTQVDSLVTNKGHGKGVYAPVAIHKKALDFIVSHRADPFFLFYPTTIPHAEMSAPDKYMKLFHGKFLPEKIYQGTDSSENFRKGPYGSQSECHAAFAAMITLLDEQVGDIVHLVDSLGIRENTIIIFTSDNGPHIEGGGDPEYFNSNGPLRGFKRDLYEGGIRVPLIVSWPAHIAEGSESDHISAFWDFMPTFNEILGNQFSESSKGDGISMLPTWLSVGQQKQHDFLYWEFYEQGGRQAVRSGKWKAVRYNLTSDRNSLPQLYDLSNDTGEAHDLAGKHPAMAKKLSDIMKENHVPSPVFEFR